MNTLRKSIVIGLTVLGMGGATLAAHAVENTPGQQAKHEQMREKRGEHFAKQQAKLHDALKLTAGQEQAWSRYQAAIKPEMHERGEHGDRAAWATMPAPQRMEKMVEMSKKRTAKMEQHLAAVNTFYSMLTPEQKKAFDANAMGGEHGWHGERHEHGGMKKH